MPKSPIRLLRIYPADRLEHVCEDTHHVACCSMVRTSVLEHLNVR